MSKTTLARFGESIARHYNGIRTAAGLRTLLPRRWQSEESRLTARQPKVESFVRVIAPFALAFGVIHARPAEPPIVGAAKPAQEVQIAQAGPHAPALSGPSGSQDARPEARRPAQVQPAAVSQARRQSLSNRGAYTAPADRRKMAYHAIIEQVAAEEGVDPALVRAVVQAESEYNPRSHSHVGAIGLMQLMPATARGLGVDDPWDPEQNIRGGTRFLRELLATSVWP